MVGDRLDYDMRPAKAAGMATVWVLRGEAPDDPTPAQLAEPDVAIEDLTQLVGCARRTQLSWRWRCSSLAAFKRGLRARDVGHLVSAAELLGGPLGQVADRHDPDDLALVDDRQVADVERHHLVGRLGDVGLRPDRLEMPPRHAVRHLDGVRVAAGRDEVHDVALGHDALQDAVGSEDHDRGDAVGAHGLRDVGERVRRHRPS